MLKVMGFNVVVAEDGRQAVEIFRERQSDISAVLLDMTMPEMSGQDAMREIVAMAPDVPVILSSGYSQEAAVHPDNGVDPAAFIEKPYGLPELRRTFERVLTAAG